MIGGWFGHFKILGLRYLSDFQVEPIMADGCTNLDCKAEVRLSYTEFHSFFFFRSSFLLFLLSFSFFHLSDLPTLNFGLPMIKCFVL